ncbi:hypothetical protein ACR6C2_37840 [Streptomyces sp. INA 01156]
MSLSAKEPTAARGLLRRTEYLDAGRPSGSATRPATPGCPGPA